MDGGYPTVGNVDKATLDQIAASKAKEPEGGRQHVAKCKDCRKYTLSCCINGFVSHKIKCAAGDTQILRNPALDIYSSYSR